MRFGGKMQHRPRPVFGEQALLSGEPRSATVRAVEPVEDPLGVGEHEPAGWGERGRARAAGPAPPRSPAEPRRPSTRSPKIRGSGLRKKRRAIARRMLKGRPEKRCQPRMRSARALAPWAAGARKKRRRRRCARCRRCRAWRRAGRRAAGRSS